MRPQFRLLMVCASATLLILGVGALGISRLNRATAERGAVRVVPGEQFPKRLNCEIYLGSGGSPHFRVEGDERGRVRAATVDLDLGPSVSIIRSEGEVASYVLYLFREDEEGKVVGLFDLNMDGTWDVKKCPTRKQNFILLDGQWTEVSHIAGLQGRLPTADGQGAHYEFRGRWTKVAD